MIKTEIRKAKCGKWEEMIRAPINIDERELAEKFMRKRSFPFLLNTRPSLKLENWHPLLWRFEDRFGTTVCFEIDNGSGTEAWLKS
jgi:hypothetical protein